MLDREFNQGKPLKLASLLVVLMGGKVERLLEVEHVVHDHGLVKVVVLNVHNFNADLLAGLSVLHSCCCLEGVVDAKFVEVCLLNSVTRLSQVWTG